MGNGGKRDGDSTENEPGDIHNQTMKKPKEESNPEGCINYKTENRKENRATLDGSSSLGKLF